MDVVEEYIENAVGLDGAEKRLIRKLYLELSLDPDSPDIESKFDKVLEKEKNG